MRVFLVDASAILLFAALGRRNHGEGTALIGVLVVAAPFLAGWTTAWFITGLHRTPTSARRTDRRRAIAPASHRRPTRTSARNTIATTTNAGASPRSRAASRQPVRTPV